MCCSLRVVAMPGRNITDSRTAPQRHGGTEMCFVEGCCDTWAKHYRLTDGATETRRHRDALLIAGCHGIWAKHIDGDRSLEGVN
jgi:hypothetical protein